MDHQEVREFWWQSNLNSGNSAANRAHWTVCDPQGSKGGLPSLPPPNTWAWHRAGRLCHPCPECEAIEPLTPAEKRMWEDYERWRNDPHVERSHFRPGT